MLNQTFVTAPTTLRFFFHGCPIVRVNIVVLSGIHKWHDKWCSIKVHTSTFLISPRSRMLMLPTQQPGDWVIKIPIYENLNDKVLTLLSSCYKVVTHKQSCYIVVTIPIIKNPRLPSDAINNQVLHSIFHSLSTHSNTYLSIGVPFAGTLSHSSNGWYLGVWRWRLSESIPTTVNPDIRSALDFGKYIWHLSQPTLRREGDARLTSASSMEGNARSRHQRLFEKNVGKTGKRRGLRTLSERFGSCIYARGRY